MKFISPDRPAFDFFMDDILRPASIGNATINERTLILESKMNNQSRDMKFKVLDSKKDSEREIKLDTEDIALITHIRLSVQKVKEVNGYIIPLTPDLTYADKDFFNGVKDSKKEVEAINAVWDGGKLSLESKTAKRLTEFDTFKLQYIPETKVSGLPALGMSNAGKGFYPLVNPFVLSGRAENDITLQLGYMVSEVMEGKWDAEGDLIEGAYNVVRLRLSGLVAVNAAEAYGKWLATNQK